MNPDLMHSAGVWFAEDNTRRSIEAQLFESCRAILALRRHFANTNFVANHFDGFFALNDSSERLRTNKNENNRAC
jgi:hypothetical protein